MKKLRKNKTLSRDFQQRKALLNTLFESLIKHKKITTTLAKAKYLRPYAEKKMTHAIAGNRDEGKRVSKIRILSKNLSDKSIKELFEIAKLYQKSEGGYLRIIKLPDRKSDKAKMALLEWTKRVEMKDVGGKDSSEIKNQSHGVNKKDKKTRKSIENKKDVKDNENKESK